MIGKGSARKLVHPLWSPTQMKLFLSWSGDLSRKVACEFRDWLPSVLQSVHPYVSSEDIDKGARWSTDIAKELEASVYGMLIITKDNLEAPWLNFEAGALSKTVEKSRVSPFLFNIKRSEVQGPLLQFQSTVLDDAEILKLVQSINKSSPEGERLDDARVEKVFEVWYPHLKTKLDSLSRSKIEMDGTLASKPAPAKAEAAILEEILELVRDQTKLLRSPETLLPVAYLHNAVGRKWRPSPREVGLANLVNYITDKANSCRQSIMGTFPEDSRPEEAEEWFKYLYHINRASEDLRRLLEQGGTMEENS
jgi:hypothetical protein